MLLVVMSREKSVLRALLLKLGIVVAISSAGFVYSRLRARMTKPYLPPPSSLPVSGCCSEVDSRGIDQGKDYVPDLRSAAASGPEETSAQGASVGLSSSAIHGRDVLLLQEFNDLVEEFDTSRAFRTAGKDVYEQEIKHLRNMVRVLREREQNLEVQLLEYYGLKEQESAVEELKNQLKINNMETKLFTLKIASLQSENQRLEKQVADHEKVVAELQTAKCRIKVLKKKLRHEVEQNREQILSVQKRVARLQEQEASADNHDAKSKLGSLKVLEGEAEELRQSNARLQIENSELARKLESTQILANSVLENPEAEALNKMRECLMLENEDLKKRMEQLQEDRCADAEELVYLRWINACLRYELRNFTPIPGKTVAKDLNKSLSHKSEEKAKQLILEYARAEGMDSMDFDCDQWSCSQAFYSTDNGEADDFSFGNSSAKKTPNSRRIKFFKKLRRLILGKDVHNQSQASPTSKTDNPEDFDSSTWSSGRGNDFVNMLQSNSDRFTTPPQSSPSTFLDVDQIKDREKFRRNSDCGPYGYRKHNIAGREDTLDSPLDRASYSHRKSDVMKFAEALKQSGTGGEKPQRAAGII
ncbi:hypothetical protein Goari_022319 [Gossypium aridum]|uniref:Protein CHUP1, chloroplastic-like n=1 Tax=Gossypium aridum TaxID=34290 RepID=A0A7J8YUZ7_GOSAI|nr:hypothetical protein [Gossypium aridum]